MIQDRIGFSALPYRQQIQKQLFRQPAGELKRLAIKSWEISPAESRTAPSAYFLPGQLERVTGWAFATAHPGETMRGSSVVHGATTGYLLKDVWLMDGTLYKDGSSAWLLPKTRRLPSMITRYELAQGALYCTAMGNKYFGQWLMDDCVTYSLASAAGIPVTTSQRVNMHTQEYESLLGMNPLRLNDVHFKELMLFDDIGQNISKHRRFREMSQKLSSAFPGQSHPGVFIMRGSTGERRLMQNELELAEYLSARRGFRIVEPEKMKVSDILRACTGAQTVIGMEGSALMHGILVLKERGNVLTLQPPNRFVKVYKDLTDRDNQNFGFVVGYPGESGFIIDPVEVERTLDLFPHHT